MVRGRDPEGRRRRLRVVACEPRSVRRGLVPGTLRSLVTPDRYNSWLGSARIRSPAAGSSLMAVALAPVLAAYLAGRERAEWTFVYVAPTLIARTSSSNSVGAIPCPTTSMTFSGPIVPVTTPERGPGHWGVTGRRSLGLGCWAASVSHNH